MGRSYWFECSKCGYRAQVSGGPDRGFNFYLQTVSCVNCKRLFDAVTKVRVADTRGSGPRSAVSIWNNRMKLSLDPVSPPAFQSLLNRLPPKGVKHFRWLLYSLQCPVSSSHKVETWNAPNTCPRCVSYLERP